MEGLDLGQTSNPSLVWKRDVFKLNDDDDDDDDNDDDFSRKPLL